jgi:hypothetical protein
MQHVGQPAMQPSPRGTSGPRNRYLSQIFSLALGLPLPLRNIQLNDREPEPGAAWADSSQGVSFRHLQYRSSSEQDYQTRAFLSMGRSIHKHRVLHRSALGGFCGVVRHRSRAFSVHLADNRGGVCRLGLEVLLRCHGLKAPGDRGVRIVFPMQPPTPQPARPTTVGRCATPRRPNRQETSLRLARQEHV